jgi:protein subunit release factor B
MNEIPEIHLTKKDFKLEFYSGTGAGGQSRNKNQYCCRITHIESGLVSVGTETKSRITNQKNAFERLVNKIIVWYQLKEEKNTKSNLKTDEVIRNYHGVRNEVLDKASGLKQPYKYVVDNANIGEMIEARRTIKGCESL